MRSARRNEEPLISELLEEARNYILQEGFVKGGHLDVEGGGYDLVGAINVANHGVVEYTEDVPRRYHLQHADRVRVGRMFRLVLDVIEPDVDHQDVSLYEVKRRLESWNDEFIRQDHDVLAALKRAIDLARYREDVGLLH